MLASPTKEPRTMERTEAAASVTASRSAEIPLILAAIELFGRDGFSAVSTRALCERAGTNVSSIKYHFGGKDELYRAAVVYVVEQLKPRIELMLSALAQGRALAGDDPALQARLIKQVIGNLLRFFLGNEDIPQFMPFVLREFLMPGPAFDHFYEALPRHLHELFTELVAMVEGSDPEDERTIVRAHALLGQVMLFHVARHVLFRRTGWTAFSAAQIELIAREVGTLTLNALGLEDPDP
jgi:AcrR family transcriptional regulator